jgi:hypothetical protein
MSVQLLSFLLVEYQDLFRSGTRARSVFWTLTFTQYQIQEFTALYLHAPLLSYSMVLTANTSNVYWLTNFTADSYYQNVLPYQAF